MTNDKKNKNNAKIKRMINLLKTASSLDDMEIIKSSIDCVVEMLEEEIKE